MIHFPALQFLPPEQALFQRHVAVRAVLLRDAQGAGVQVEVPLAELLPRRNVGVSVQQDVPRHQRRRILGVVTVAVGGVDQLLPHRQDAVVRQYRELQHHLIHLGFAVAPHTAELRLGPVQQRDDLLRRIAAGQVVAGAVVEQISEKQETIRALPLKGVEHLAAVKSRPVQVGCDHPFHLVSSFALKLILL